MKKFKMMNLDFERLIFFFSFAFLSIIILYVVQDFGYYKVNLHNIPQQLNESHKFVKLFIINIIKQKHLRLKSWMRSQLDLRRRIRATCKKYNISSDGNYLTWVNF